MYVEEFALRSKMIKLLEAMKIDPNEDVSNYTATCFHGYLKVYHHAYAIMQHKKRDEFVSIFSDFKIIKLYNSAPSEYDQQHYINVMSDIFKNKNYKNEAKKALKNEKKFNSDDENDEEENENED